MLHRASGLHRATSLTLSSSLTVIPLALSSLYPLNHLLPLKPGKYKQVRFMVSIQRSVSGYLHWSMLTSSDLNQGSGSCFETVILPTSAQSSQDLTSPKDITHPYMKLPEKQADRWHICSNVPSSSDGKTCFTISSQDDDGLEARTDGIKGRMDDGKAFVDLLQPGDRIAVIARAMVRLLLDSSAARNNFFASQFPQWANHVYEVSVEVFYSV